MLSSAGMHDLVRKGKLPEEMFIIEKNCLDSITHLVNDVHMAVPCITREIRRL